MKKEYLAVYYSLVTDDVFYHKIEAEDDEKAWNEAQRLLIVNYRHCDSSFDLFINTAYTDEIEHVLNMIRSEEN